MGAETEVPWISAHASAQSMGSGIVSESEFPAGLRVLVVDDDRICLLILERLLRQCLYRVTTCERAVDALKMLRDNKDGFDMVISDVHMPDMDGYKLLELVGLEMDLPVIMMSSNSETSAVMKGIKHGACDYLLKPVRIEELKNIWQHVYRRKQRDLDSDERSRHDDGADHHANDGADGALKSTKKRKDNSEEEDDFEPDNEDPATSKKPRVVWSVDLHQKFVNAVNSLGIDKAVPKRILELMDVKGLTRENVASHLQKYRLYLKRISGVTYQGGGALGAGYFAAADERFLSTGAGLMGDFRSQLPGHTLVSSLHSGLLDRVDPNSAVDPLFLGQLATLQGINSGLTGKPPYAVPLLSSAHSLNHGLDTKHLGRGLGGHVSSHAHNDRLSSFTLSSGAHVDQLTGQENHILSDHKTNSLIMQILQQQRTASQMTSRVLSETRRSNAQYVESSPALPKVNNSVSAHIPSCRSSPEMATLANFTAYEPTTGLGPYRKRGVDVGPHSNVFEIGSINKSSSLSCLAPQSISPGVELSSKDGLLTGLHSILSDQVGGNTTFQVGAGPTHYWQGWHQDHGAGTRQGGLSPLNSNFNQGSVTLSQASNLGYSQEPKTGWIFNFPSDLVDDIDVKPLATSTNPVFEPGIGQKEVVKGASLESLLVSKAGEMPEPFPSADDLLSCYMKQQQQEMVSLSENDAADGYTLGNM